MVRSSCNPLPLPYVTISLPHFSYFKKNYELDAPFARYFLNPFWKKADYVNKLCVLIPSAAWWAEAGLDIFCLGSALLFSEAH